MEVAVHIMRNDRVCIRRKPLVVHLDHWLQQHRQGQLVPLRQPVPPVLRVPLVLLVLLVQPAPPIQPVLMGLMVLTVLTGLLDQ